MAKAKITDNGNVKVTMTMDQWIAINAVLSHVRMGSKPGMTTDISKFLIDVEPFNSMHCFDDYISNACEVVGYTIDADGFVIELKA